MLSRSWAVIPLSLLALMACNTDPTPTPTVSVYDAFTPDVADLIPQDVFNCMGDREGERWERLSASERAEQEAQFADGIPEQWQAALHAQGLVCWAWYGSDVQYLAFMEATGDTIVFLPSWQLCIEEAMGLEGVVATAVYMRLRDLSVFSNDALWCLPVPIPDLMPTPTPWATPVPTPTAMSSIPQPILLPTPTPFPTPTPLQLDIQVTPPVTPVQTPPSLDSIVDVVTTCALERVEEHADLAYRATAIPELWSTAMVLSCWAAHGGSDELYRLYRESHGIYGPPKIQPSWQLCLEEAVGYGAGVEHAYDIFVTPPEEVEFSGPWSQCVT